MRRKAKKQKAAKAKVVKNATQKYKRHPETAVEDVVRSKVLQHIQSAEPPKKILSQLSETEALLIQTQSMTVYAAVSFDDLKAMVSDIERPQLHDFLTENNHKKIVSIHEDDNPLLTFAFENNEIGLPCNTMPEEGTYISRLAEGGTDFYVEGVYGEGDPFYYVDFVEAQYKDDMSAVSYQLDRSEWEQLVADFQLVHELEFNEAVT